VNVTLLERVESQVEVSNWPPYPTSYEINTRVWLNNINQKYGRKADLSSVPSAEWDAIAAYGFDSVWLMGVWERSPAGIAIANQNKGLLDDFRRALPDFNLEDNVGSPYCVRRYVVDAHLGGPEGLAVARRELSNRGMNLILDFVPNHVAPDHPWVAEHPENFIQGSADDARNDPSSYIEISGTVFALGRDPFFPAWPDRGQSKILVRWKRKSLWLRWELENGLLDPENRLESAESSRRSAMAYGQYSSHSQ